jgi:hypothetical protein
MPQPHVSEIAAPMDEDHAIADCLGETFTRIRFHVAAMSDMETNLRQPAAFANPNCVISDIGVIGKIDECTLPPLSCDWIQCGSDPFAQTLEQRVHRIRHIHHCSESVNHLPFAPDVQRFSSNPFELIPSACELCNVAVRACSKLGW